MKRIFKYLLALPLAALAISCGKQEIVFDHEKPGFDVQEGKILIEAILPSTTTESDDIYIAGPFAGGDSLAVWGNDAYKLAHSTVISQKWGVYLDPAAFKDGKTLEDGFWFISYKEGRERSGKGEETVHTLSAHAGQSYNVYVTSWKSRFESSSEDESGFPEHDGVRIYIIDQTGWDAIALYQWGDQNDLGGGWPGAQVAGTATVKDVEYVYFEYGEDIYGLNQNLIFNNNAGGIQLKDYNLTFEEGVQDYFFIVTADGVTAFDPINPDGGGDVDPDPKPQPTAVIQILVDDQTGWDAIALYQYGEVNSLGGSWPGAQVSATTEEDGMTYKVFQYTEEVYGLNQYLIFNNNGNDIQLDEFPLTFAKEAYRYYFKVTSTEVTLVKSSAGTVN